MTHDIVSGYNIVMSRHEPTNEHYLVSAARRRRARAAQEKKAWVAALNAEIDCALDGAHATDIEKQALITELAGARSEALDIIQDGAGRCDPAVDVAQRLAALVVRRRTAG